MTSIVLLPGLDGTGTLFRRFLDARPPGARLTRVAFPPDRVLTYDELAEHVFRKLPVERFVLVAESFSGPLALRLARRVNPLAVVLCASFVRAPVPRAFGKAPLSFFLRARAPASIVRVLFADGDREIASELVKAVATVDRDVIASRIRMTLEVDAVPDLLACRSRILYLRAKRDFVVGKRQLELIRKTRGDATIAEIDGPHLLLQTRPKECWECIRSFVDRPLMS